MELRLRVVDQAGSLYRWLLADVDVAVCVQGMGPPERDDDMGAFEVINTVVANGAALASLVVSILAWRSNRPKDSGEVRIEHNGVVVVVRDPAPETVAAITAGLGQPSRVDDGQAV